MRLATTTGDFEHYFSNDIDRVRAVAEAGFRYVDLSLYSGDREDWAYFRPDWEERVRALRDTADRAGITFVQSHAPGGHIQPLHAEGFDLLVRSTVRAIEICGMLGIPNTVIHTGFSDTILRGEAHAKERYFEANLPFIRALIPAMERCGVNVLIENSCTPNIKNRWFFLEGREMKEFIDYVGHPLLHACWDVGHANTERNQYQDLIDLGSDLCALHIHDNRSGRDEHMLPYMGTINMDEILCALIDMNYQGYFTFECDSMLTMPNYWLGKRRAFTRDTRLAAPPLHLQKMMEKVLFETGVYLLKSYDVYEN